MSDWSSTCVGMASLQKFALPWSYLRLAPPLALSSSGAKGKYFLTSAHGLLINVTLQFHSRGWITIPGVPSKKEWNSTGWFCSPPPSPSIGVGIHGTSWQQIGGVHDLSRIHLIHLTNTGTGIAGIAPFTCPLLSEACGVQLFLIVPSSFQNAFLW